MKDILYWILGGGVLGVLVYYKGRALLTKGASDLANKEVEKLQDKIDKVKIEIAKDEQKVSDIEQQIKDEQAKPQSSTSLVDYFVNRYKR